MFDEAPQSLGQGRPQWRDDQHATVRRGLRLTGDPLGRPVRR
jgi:hypothetical protein